MTTALKEVLPKARPMVARTEHLWENMYSVANHKVLDNDQLSALSPPTPLKVIKPVVACRLRRTCRWILLQWTLEL